MAPLGAQQAAGSLHRSEARQTARSKRLVDPAGLPFTSSTDDAVTRTDAPAPGPRGQHRQGSSR